MKRTILYIVMAVTMLVFSNQTLLAQKSYPVLQTQYSTDYINWEPAVTFKIISKLVVDDTDFRLYNGDKLIGTISKGKCIVTKLGEHGIDYTSSTDDNSVKIVVRMYIEKDYTYTPIQVFAVYRVHPEDKSHVDYYMMNLDPATIK